MASLTCAELSLTMTRPTPSGRLAERVVRPMPAGGGDREGWVLALETRDLLTVKSLEASGFQAHHIVVPNPIKAEVQAIRGVLRATRQQLTALRAARGRLPCATLSRIAPQ